jgi:hypothetical protein
MEAAEEFVRKITVLYHHHTYSLRVRWSGMIFRVVSCPVGLFFIICTVRIPYGTHGVQK